MSEMNEREVIIRCIDGFKVAAESLSLLGVMQRNSDFVGLAKMVSYIKDQVARLATSKAMSQTNLNKALQMQTLISGNMDQ